MAEVKFDSPRAIEIKNKLGDHPAPTPENLALQDEYGKITGLDEVTRKKAVADTIEQRLADLTGFTGVGAGMSIGIPKIAGSIKGLVSDSKLATWTKTAQVIDEDGLAATKLKEYYKDIDPILKNPDGTPRTFYHGTNADFSEFKDMSAGQKSGKYNSKGFYFTSDPEFAGTYATRENGSVIPVHINAEKIYDASGLSPLKKRSITPDMINDLKSQGYDGISGFRYPHEVTVFEPNQIKGIYNKAPTKESNDMMKALPLVGGGLAASFVNNNN